jgi:outer membrane protein OmpA-like peptidoglycan-associated protein
MSRYSVHRVKYARVIPSFVLTLAALGLLSYGFAAAVPQTNKVATGAKAKAKGRIVQREEDTITIADSAGAKTVILLTDTTSVKTKSKGLGLFRRGEGYEVTSLIRGLIIEVEGTGNEKGQLMADKIRFDENDLKTALTVSSQTAPLEEANKKLSGQVEEVGATANAAKADAARANESAAAAHDRISGLDNFDEKRKVTSYFAINSYVLAAQDMKDLDTLAQEALQTKGYILEVTGFADPSGNAQKNIELSQKRADTVVKYLAINGKVPMRKIVTPIGYGATRAGAANTPEAKKQERRVETKLLVNRSITAQ